MSWVSSGHTCGILSYSAAAIFLMYPPLLSFSGVSGFVLNGIGAAVLAGIYVTRRGLVPERGVAGSGAE